jgi:CCR4-NOT transcription complex subunit 6
VPGGAGSAARATIRASGAARGPSRGARHHAWRALPAAPARRPPPPSSPARITAIRPPHRSTIHPAPLAPLAASAEEVPEEGATDARFSVKCRWYRAVAARGGAPACWAHPEREAGVQCILCLRAKADARRAYHCSPECLVEHWAFHKDFHLQAARAAEAAEGERRAAAGGGGAAAAGGGASTPGGPGGNYSSTHGSHADHLHRSPSYSYGGSAGEAWAEVGRGRVYVPTPDDVGATLKFECAPHDVASPYPEAGKAFSLVSARVRPAPDPPRRALLALPPAGPVVAKGRFTLLSYNLLADLYATPEQFPYCPAHALAWPYRRAALLRELLAYAPDIMCLQEVQSNHYADFLAPELAAAGYAGVYKKKTAEVYTRAAYATDGCATFFRRDRFALVKKYEVEFNKAALSLADAMPPEARKAALGRLLKDNVALIAVLEALDPPFAAPPPAGAPPRRQLLCVANTHIHSNPELGDVKLWQVHTLLKGLEKIAASADIPMLVAGDFNATPGSAAHALLVRGGVPAGHPELAADPLGILRPASKLAHALPLASAYAALAAGPPPPGGGGGGDAALGRQRRRLDAATREPLFTNFTRDFRGTLDYVLHSADALAPTALLELPDESEVRCGGAAGMPNEAWPSDHVALMAEFCFRAPADAAGGGAAGSPPGTPEAAK